VYSREVESYDVLIVQDDYHLASIWAEVLQAEGVRSVGKTRSVKEAIWSIRECKPSVVLLDLNIYLTDDDPEDPRYLREFGGYEVARRAALAGLDMSRVVVTSACVESPAQLDLEALGVRWFLQDLCALSQLVHIVRGILSGPTNAVTNDGELNSRRSPCTAPS
jgi:DNA-binding NarL/FixJ family response regulator